MKFSEAINNYMAWRRFQVSEHTIIRAATELRIWCLIFHDRDVETITIDEIVSHMGLMKDLKYGDSALHERSLQLRLFFNFLTKMGNKVPDHELVPIVKRGFKFPRVLSDENYQKLLKAIPNNGDGRHIRNRALAMMYWDTGVRDTELLTLDVGDIDTVKMNATVRTEKNRGSKPFRQIFWTKETNNALKKWLAKREFLKDNMILPEPNALFISISSWNAGKRLTHAGVGSMLRKYSVKAKIPTANAHSMRHHMGRDLAMKGANNSTISAVLGHANLSSSQIYTALDDKQTEEQYRKFKGY